MAPQRRRRRDDRSVGSFAMVDRPRHPVFVAAAIAVCLTAQVRTARAECRKSNIYFTIGTSHVRETWQLNKNEACSRQIISWGWTTIDNMVISERALHGTAGINDSVSGHGYAYHPRQGFIGKDHFQATADNHNSHQIQSTVKITFDVDIEVVDKP
jgi:hypothetical protein